MKNKIDFIDYLYKYNINESCLLKHLKEDIIFSDIGIQICLGFDKKALFSINFEPEYQKVEYAEIDIEFHSIIHYSFTIEGREVFLKNHAYYSNVESFILSNNSLEIIFLLDNGKKAKLSIAFSYLVFDYDISWMIDVNILKTLYINKKENNRLLYMLSQEISDEMLISISEADYGEGKEESYKILKEIQETCKLPKKLTFQNFEILCLHNHTKVKKQSESISTSFSLLHSLLGDYQGTIIEDPLEYWLIKLSVLSKDFSKEYKEELLSFYISYLFTKHTYSNPYILLLFLITTMMFILDYSKRDIERLLAEFYRLDYVKRYEYHFFPTGTLNLFREMLSVINNKKEEEQLFHLLDEMILEYSNDNSGG